MATFNYGTGSNYSKGILGHDDVLRISTDFLLERPLFRTLLAQQFPFVFVDESQDTTLAVVEALKAVELQERGSFCLGFFGDPMQRIYPTGIGSIELGDGWLTIEKPENFRCPRAVLTVANAIRQGGDNLVQTRGRTETVAGVTLPVEGTARAFVLPAGPDRNELLGRVRRFLADQEGDEAWLADNDASVRVLVIVHRMAATRLGFGDVYSALNDKAPESFKNGFLDASAWPLRPFVSFALPLSAAVLEGREFDAMALLREHCEALRVKDGLRGKDVRELLATLREASLRVSAMMHPQEAYTVRQVLEFLRDSKLIALDPRLLSYLEARLPAAEDGAGLADNEDADKEVNAMEAFLACPAGQLLGYRQYLENESPFATQQGIKGAEFPRVLVVLDDEEGTHTQFSYDKYFGIKPPSDTDLRNIQDGNETVVDRTRRLFYVCCTRALNDLAVVMFSSEPALAERKLREAAIFPQEAIFDHGALA